MDLSTAVSGNISLWYKNPRGDGFGVYYRVNGGPWNELFYTGAGHTNWTELSVNLTGFAENYQIGFKQRDEREYGINLDDISVNIVGNSLCEKGNASNIVASTGTYTWTCEGLNGGNNTSCSAERICAATTYMGYEIPKTDFGVTTDLLSKTEVITGGVRYSTGAFICSAGAFSLTGTETHFTTCDTNYVVVDGTSATSSCSPVITGACGTVTGVTDADVIATL